MVTTLYHPRRERWPQFTLRGLLVVVTLTALLMPWVKAQHQHWRCRESCREKLRRIGIALHSGGARRSMFPVAIPANKPSSPPSTH
jgi:hypothetical protein